MIEKIVGLTENLTPIALIGAGGIGKTSVALTVLHHHRTKERFGDDRRFIRCDQFPASRAHFLNRLSEVIGAGVENPEDLTPLRSFLSSRKMILFLDNAESILDPQGPNAQEVYEVVEELSEFNNICLCFTSRISTVPPACETLDIPTLSMEAAYDTFHGIYKNGGRSDLINDILRQLDFHPLSITILATVAYHSRWDADRLTKEWEKQRTGILHTRHNKSLSTTIELSLASPMFQELGPDARGLLGVVAFFPQGINENHIDWLFPTISDRTSIFDTFCVLSLTHRSNGFIMMLAPLRDYLCPKDPASSTLLRTTKDCYLRRLSVDVNPGKPGFDEARWITSEDMNVEHLLGVFASIDEDSVEIWDAYTNFIRHLAWHKRRLVILGPKIEALSDDHPSKSKCLFQLSSLFGTVGNRPEEKRLLTCALKLWREQGDDLQVANALRSLSCANRYLGLYEEGIRQAKEALEIYKRVNDELGQAQSWAELARLFYVNKQPNASKEAVLRVIELSGEENQYSVCECYRILSDIYNSKGETGRALKHLETARGIAASFNWDDQLFWISYAQADLFFSEKRYDDAYAQLERTRAHTANDAYRLGRVMELRGRFCYGQRRFEEAKAEISSAADALEKLGATRDLQACRLILRNIEEEMDEPATSRK